MLAVGLAATVTVLVAVKSEVQVRPPVVMDTLTKVKTVLAVAPLTVIVWSTPVKGRVILAPPVL